MVNVGGRQKQIQYQIEVPCCYSSVFVVTTALADPMVRCPRGATTTKAVLLESSDKCHEMPRVACETLVASALRV